MEKQNWGGAFESAGFNEHTTPEVFRRAVAISAFHKAPVVWSQLRYLAVFLLLLSAVSR